MKPFEGEVHLVGGKVVPFQLSEDDLRSLGKRSRFVIPPNDFETREGLLNIAIQLVKAALIPPLPDSLDVQDQDGRHWVIPLPMVVAMVVRDPKATPGEGRRIGFGASYEARPT